MSTVEGENGGVGEPSTYNNSKAIFLRIFARKHLFESHSLRESLLATFQKVRKEIKVVNLITAIIGFRIVIPYCVNESTSHLPSAIET
jgi:hypothetical protein